MNSIRYAVSQAVGRQAASAKLSSPGLSTRLPAGTRSRVANVPGKRSENNDRRGS